MFLHLTLNTLPVCAFKEPEKPIPVKRVQEEPVPTKPKAPPTKGRVRKTLSVLRDLCSRQSYYKYLLQWQYTIHVCVRGCCVVCRFS